MEYEPILALFQGFEPRIWIQIGIKVLLIHNTGIESEVALFLVLTPEQK
jgi:hypothetical protein